ncbi:hypothetical protein BHM03_00054548 [Ensete ventricosum]|nr:hypothetical protein BHM03_00054548 [Ensete ventricosum]
MGYLAVVLGTVSVVLISCFWKAFMHLTWRPYVITQAYRKQGVRGPAYRFWSGSLEEIRSIRKAAGELILDTHSHDITTRVLPHFAKWIAEYAQPLICISEQEMIKQVLASKYGSYARTDPSPAAMALVGKGLTNIDGSEWARHRRVVNPAFAMDKLKVSPSPITRFFAATLTQPAQKSSETT